MRAVVVDRIGDPEVIRVVDLPMPRPGAGEVRVRVAYCALHPMDVNARSGRMRWGVPPLPFTLGYEYSGRVDAVGADVDAGLIGRRIAVAGSWGGLADFAVAPLARVTALPDGIDYRAGAAYGSATLAAWHALYTVGRLSPGMLVVLHSAAGMVGIMASQIAREAGATVVGLVGSPEKLAIAREFGCTHVIDYRAEPDWAVKVLALGRHADIIVDGVQGPGAVQNLQAIAPLGTIVYLGAASGEPAPPVIVPELIAKSAIVAGLVIYAATAKTGGNELALIHARIASGAWRVPTNRPQTLDEATNAHRVFEARSTAGRNLFIVGGEV